MFVPDFYFIDHKGFWRGATTGIPCTYRWESVEEKGVLENCEHGCFGVQRVQVALRAKRLPWMNVSLVKVVQFCDTFDGRQFLKHAGLMSRPLDASQWHLHRGILELDGNANAWGNRWRMASGSVVFRVESTYVNAYSRCQKPWKHYIPIHSNLSNLEEVTSVVRSSNATVLQDLENIAARSRALAKTFTYERELRRVAVTLNHVWSESERMPREAIKEMIANSCEES